MGGRGEAGGGQPTDKLWQLSFPPFYTLQPHAETRRKQLETWSRIVLEHCQKKGLSSINVGDLANSSDLFVNDDIKRRAGTDLLQAIWDHLESKGNLEWVDPKKSGKSRAHIYWRSPEEWSDLIYGWVRASGMNSGTVCTFFELTEGSDTVDQPFHGLDTDVLLKALKRLQAQGKAELFQGDEGVKFF